MVSGIGLLSDAAIGVMTCAAGVLPPLFRAGGSGSFGAPDEGADSIAGSSPLEITNPDRCGVGVGGGTGDVVSPLGALIEIGTPADKK